MVLPIHGKITKCVNKGTLTIANYNSVGGIVGYTNICTVAECFNAGNITGKTPVGGICGGTKKT